MSKRIDHAAQARKALAVLEGEGSPDEVLIADVLAHAQLHATLAVAEQLRLANLIAVAQMEGGPYKAVNGWTRSIKDADGFYVGDEDAGPHIEHEIRKGLDL